MNGFLFRFWSDLRHRILQRFLKTEAGVEGIMGSCQLPGQLAWLLYRLYRLGCTGSVDGMIKHRKCNPCNPTADGLQ